MPGCDDATADRLVTISDDDAAELRRLHDAATAQDQVLRRLTAPARIDYYRKLLQVQDAGATQQEIADALGRKQPTISEVLASARRFLGRG